MSTLIGRGTSLTMMAFFLHARDAHRLGMHDLLVLAELLDEFLDAVLVVETLWLRVLDPLVGEDDFEAGIEERQLAQAATTSSFLNSIVS